jgi:hypothetical protein
MSQHLDVSQLAGLAEMRRKRRKKPKEETC